MALVCLLVVLSRPSTYNFPWGELYRRRILDDRDSKNNACQAVAGKLGSLNYNNYFVLDVGVCCAQLSTFLYDIRSNILQVAARNHGRVCMLSPDGTIKELVTFYL